MAELIFHKCQASYNDFIFFYQSENTISLQTALTPDCVREICHRHRGIGADGIFIINGKDIFHLDPDGAESFCVMGSLCLAEQRSLKFPVPENFRLSNISVTVSQEDRKNCVTFESILKTSEKRHVNGLKGHYADIGNPHFFIDHNPADLDTLNKIGKKLVTHPSFKKGANISFIKKISDTEIKIATFERGVEQITGCCGSACSAYTLLTESETLLFRPVSDIPISVSHNVQENSLTLKGEAYYVFKGTYNLSAADSQY